MFLRTHGLKGAPQEYLLDPTDKEVMRRHKPVTSCLLFLLLVSTGCATSITPPPDPADPVVVHLFDHGRHPSLVLPRPDGSFVRYVYGDWKWYALADTGFFQAFDAMLLPGPGALGRKLLDSQADFDTLRQRDPAEHTHVIRVSRSDAAALDGRLDALFERNAPTATFNSAYDLDFVHHPRSYSFFHNCNHEMKTWLQSLGCRVQGAAVLSKWKVKQR